MFNMAKMMKQAQEMQFKLQEVQEKLQDMEVQAEAGGGLVKIRMACSGKVLAVELDQALMDGDKETLEDLIIAAMNTVNDAKEEKVKEETQKVMQGINMPDLSGEIPQG